MTNNPGCRIGRVKRKQGGADLVILPPSCRKKTQVFPYVGGCITIRSDDEILTFERATWLLDQAKDELQEIMRGG